MDINQGDPNVLVRDDNSQSHDDKTHSTGQGTADQSSSDSQLTDMHTTGCASGGQDNTDCDVEKEQSETDWLKVAMDVMMKMDEGVDIDEQEYEKVQRMLRDNPSHPPEEEPQFEVEDGMFEVLDSYYQKDPQPMNPLLEDSVTEGSNEGRVLEESTTEASGAQDPSSSTSTSKVVPQSGQLDTAMAPRQEPVDLQRPSTSRQEWSFPALSFAGISLRLSCVAAQDGVSQPQPSTSAALHPPPGVGMSYMYASRASTTNNRNAREDKAIVSSILLKYNARKGSRPNSGSRGKRLTVPVEELRAVEGMDELEASMTREEWNAIASQTRRRPMALKSQQEKLVDLETLLQVFNLSLTMTAYFTVPPKSILEAFQMAYKVKKFKDLKTSYEPTAEQVRALAFRLADELLGAVPRYEDFPQSYMAGVEVPEHWFFNRFRSIGGFDRLRFYSKPRKTPWLTPIRYDERRKLRLVYVAREKVASRHPYNWTQQPRSGDPRVSELLKLCSGPPYRPLPERDTFLAMNEEVLEKYLRKFSDFVFEIRREERRRRTEIERIFDRFDMTVCEYNMFLGNYNGASGYRRSLEGPVLMQWNVYLRNRAMEVCLCIRNVMFVAYELMLLIIKYSDSWIVRNREFETMLRHKIPLFDRQAI